MSKTYSFYCYFVSLRQHKTNHIIILLQHKFPWGKTKVKFEEHSYLNVFN